MNKVERKPSFPSNPVNLITMKLIKIAAKMIEAVESLCLFVVSQGFCGVGTVVVFIGPYFQND